MIGRREDLDGLFLLVVAGALLACEDQTVKIPQGYDSGFDDATSRSDAPTRDAAAETCPPTGPLPQGSIDGACPEGTRCICSGEDIVGCDPGPRCAQYPAGFEHCVPYGDAGTGYCGHD